MRWHVRSGHRAWAQQTLDDGAAGWRRRLLIVATVVSLVINVVQTLTSLAGVHHLDACPGWLRGDGAGVVLCPGCCASWVCLPFGLFGPIFILFYARCR